MARMPRVSKVNFEAKKERHRKLFEGHYQTFLGRVFFFLKRGIAKTWYFITPSKKRLSEFMHPLDHLPAPKRLYAQICTWSMGLLVLTSVNVSNASFESDSDFGAAFEDLALESGEFITDEEGYIIKSMPLEGDTIYDQNRTEKIAHEVLPGETLSVIAYRYGISISSITYANPGLGSGNYLKVGQSINIPPKDGYYAKVKTGDNLVKLVERHKGNLDKTKEFNTLGDDETLVADAEIFIIEGQPEVTYVATTNTKSAASSSTYQGRGTGTYIAGVEQQFDVAPNSLGWIRPTSGVITTYFGGGHYGYDIADRSRPPILAASGGTVIKASVGTWGGGYGTHLIIDHGNGYQTLYAHASEIYVTVGEYVSQGQVIAKMGNTGRVYGATGIHLHFEVTYNGRKISPGNLGVF